MSKVDCNKGLYRTFERGVQPSRRFKIALNSLKKVSCWPKGRGHDPLDSPSAVHVLVKCRL